MTQVDPSLHVVNPAVQLFCQMCWTSLMDGIALKCRLHFSQPTQWWPMQCLRENKIYTTLHTIFMICCNAHWVPPISCRKTQECRAVLSYMSNRHILTEQTYLCDLWLVTWKVVVLRTCQLLAKLIWPRHRWLPMSILGEGSPPKNGHRAYSSHQVIRSCEWKSGLCK